jgi:hypothetical protein
MCGPPVSHSVRITVHRPRAGVQTAGPPSFPPLFHWRPPPRAAIKGARRAEVFPFPPPLHSRHPAHSALHSLPPPLFTSERHHPNTSSSIDPTRRASPTLLLATTCSLSRRSAAPLGECSPSLSPSSWTSSLTGVPRLPLAQARAPRAPSSSPAAHRPAVPLRQPLVRTADVHIFIAIFLVVIKPPW